MIGDLSQHNVLEKIAFYLEREGRDPDIVALLKCGACHGFALLESYAHWLQNQPRTPTDKTKLQSKIKRLYDRDDYTWFLGVTTLLANWDEKRKLTEEETIEIERFISLLVFFQSAEIRKKLLSRSTVRDIFEDTHGRTLSLDQLINFQTVQGTLEQVTELLYAKKLELPEEKRLIELSGHFYRGNFGGGHATSVFKEGGFYYFYDANNKRGRVHTTSIFKITKLIFEAYRRDYDDSLDVKFKTYSVYGANVKYHGSKAAEEALIKMAKVSHDPNLVTHSENEDTVFMLAAKIGRLDFFKACLKEEDPIMFAKITHEMYQAAFNEVVSHGDLEIAKFFIDQFKINPDMPDRYGTTPFISAATSGQLNIVTYFLENLQAIDPNALGEYGTAFQCAVYYGQFEIVKYILANPRIKIDREDILKTLESLAIYPSCLTGSRPFTKLLPQTTQSNSNTKKIVALLYQFLLENKSDDKSFNLHDFMQKILEEALKNGQFPLVMELLKKEYSLDIKKITPDTWFIFFTKLDSNVRSNQALMSELFLTLITLEDIDISNVINRNFMHISNNLFTPLYRKDLSKSSNEESKPYRGTLFMDFCKLGNLDYVKTLLKKGADPSIISKDNNSALASAAMGGHVEIVRELLTDSRVRTDAMVKSALLQVLAAENPEHKTDVISLLLNQCAKKDILALLEENSNLASVELLSRNKMLLQTLRGYETDVIKITLGARKNGLYVYPYHALALDILQSNKITDFANITSNEDELNELVNFFAYAIKADYNDFFKKVAVTNPEIVKVVFARICGNKEFKNPLQLALEYESFQMANWLLAPESKFGLDLQYSPVSLQPTSRLCEALIAAMKDGEGGLVTKVMKENEAVTKEVFLTAAQIGDTDFVKKVVNMQPEFARYFFATSENNPDWTEEKRKNFDIVQQAFQEADTEQSHLLDGQSIQKL